jgi:hypothetical protein
LNSPNYLWRGTNWTGAFDLYSATEFAVGGGLYASVSDNVNYWSIQARNPGSVGNDITISVDPDGTVVEIGVVGNAISVHTGEATWQDFYNALVASAEASALVDPGSLNVWYTSWDSLMRGPGGDYVTFPATHLSGGEDTKVFVPVCTIPPEWYVVTTLGQADTSLSDFRVCFNAIYMPGKELRGANVGNPLNVRPQPTAILLSPLYDSNLNGYTLKKNDTIIIHATHTDHIFDQHEKGFVVESMKDVTQADASCVLPAPGKALFMFVRLEKAQKNNKNYQAVPNLSA